MSYHDKLQKTGGQRKLLACDGGGIRGIISIEILARLEAELRKGSGNPLRGIQPAQVQQMNSVEHIDKMQRVGEALGKVKVMADHFMAFSI